MLERTRMVVAGLLAVLALPLAVALAPGLGLWVRRQRRAGRRAGFAVLWPCMERTLRANAEAWISTDPPSGGWAQLARRTDRYMDATRGPRGWQMPLFVLLIEWVPLVTLRRRFSHLPLAARRAIVARHYVVPGPLAPLAWSRQIARLGYHSTPQDARRAGYVPFDERRRERPRTASRIEVRA